MCAFSEGVGGGGMGGRESGIDMRGVWFKRVLKEALIKLKGVKQERVDPNSFSQTYDPEEISRDLKRVEELKKIFKNRASENPENNEQKELSDLLETIIYQRAEMDGWIGDAYTMQTSEYDDFVNGIDILAEYTQDDGPHFLGLAIDVTYSTSTQSKIKDIKGEIDSGTLSEVKYFRSTSGDDSREGRLTRIPRVVVAVDRQMLAELVALWMNERIPKDESQKTDRASGNIRHHEMFEQTLRSHPVQLLILDQIEMQLNVFIDYAKKIGKDDVAKIYADQLIIVENLKMEKNELYKRYREYCFSLKNSKEPIYKDNRAHKALEELLAQFSQLESKFKPLDRND